jgi:ABC-type uncharacterized transport system permease subunit
MTSIWTSKVLKVALTHYEHKAAWNNRAESRFPYLCVALMQFAVFLFQFTLSFFQPIGVFQAVFVLQLQHSDDAFQRLQASGQLFIFGLGQIFCVEQLKFKREDPLRTAHNW